MKTDKGIIVSIVRKKGFGFIEKDNGEEIFFHSDGVCNPSYEDLREGMPVEYMVREGKKGPKAIGVVVI